MLKELTKYVVIGILAGFIAYSFTLKKPVSIKVTESETSAASISKDSFNQIYSSVKDSVVTIKTILDVDQVLLLRIKVML